MFKKTRKQLMILYTGLMVIFLVAFITLTYIWLSFSLIGDQKEQVRLLANAELADHEDELLQWYEMEYGEDEDEEDEEDEDEYEDGQSDDEKEHEGELKEGGISKAPPIEKVKLTVNPDQQVFYYVIAADGKILDGDILFEEIHDDLLERIISWKPDQPDTKYETFSRKDKQDLELLLAAQPVIQNGQYAGTIYTGTDVTEQQNVLHQLLIIFIPLSLFFILMSSVLGYYMSGRAMVPIATSFKRQREFVGDASHELRTPLAILQSSAEVIETEEKEHMSDFSKQVLYDMKTEIKRMTLLVGDLLTLARSDSDALPLQMESFELTEVINELFRKFSSLADQRGISLHADIPQPLLITADKSRVTQLLFILLDNAIKYNVPNGKVDVKAELQQQKLVLTVKDTGIGIPQELQSRIFDRFFRVDKARSREQGSSGLGLSIAKWIVDKHDGQIQVQSDVGVGTSFTIMIPMHSK